MNTIHMIPQRLIALLVCTVACTQGFSQDIPAYRISVEVNHDRPHLQWTNRQGAVYEVLSRDKLGEGGWTRLTMVTSDAEVIEWADESAFQGARYYRVASVSGPEQALGQSLQAILENSYPALKIGVSAAVHAPDHGLWVGTAGTAWRDAEALPVKPQTRFDVASILKTFLATIILQFVEEGRLSQEDRLDQHLLLPEPVRGRIAGGITIRQLLNHTSGVGDLFDPEGTLRYEEIVDEPLKRYTPEELILFVGPSNFAPGAGWKYSNSNYILLAMIIQAKMARPVSEILRERLLEPLELRGTFFLAEEEIIGESVVGHQEFLNSEGQVGWDGIIDEISFNGSKQHEEFVVDPSFDWGLANLASTPRDLVHWAHTLYRGQLLEETSLQQMITTVPGSGGAGSAAYPWEYGLGLMRFATPWGIMYGHSGREIGCDTVLIYSPSKEWGVCVSINLWSREYIGSLTRQLMGTLASVYEASNLKSKKLRTL